MLTKRKIALLYGGKSAEHEVSVNGYAYVKTLLEKNGDEVISVYITDAGKWTAFNGDVFPIPKGIEKKGSLQTGADRVEIDAAIPLLHGNGGESGEVQGLLAEAGIPYVGADVITSAICLDKHYAKCVAQNLGIPVAKWVSFSKKTDTDTALMLCKERIGFPMFIKPRRLGSSVGAYPARSESEFRKCFSKAMEQGSNLVIVEELLGKKRELECAFYSALGTTVISPPGEVLIDGFYGYDEKYSKATITAAEADIPACVAEKIREYNEQLAQVFSLRHLARIDYFLTEKGLVFNEINTFPGFTENSLYPKLLSGMGIEPGAAIAAFVEDAVTRAL